MGGQVWVVHVTVLGDRLAACLDGVLLRWRRLRVGLGLLSGRAAPPFLFSWGGVPAWRDAKGRVWPPGLWPVGCARLDAKGGRESVGGLVGAWSGVLRGGCAA